MKFLLDTCSFLWLQSEPDRIPSPLLDQLRAPANELFLSAASSWEIAEAWSAGQVTLPEHPSVYIPSRRQISGVEALAVSEEAMLQLANLPVIHNDTVDRILICQAIVEGLTLVSPNPVLRRYPVRVQW
jgi:PIN domain nuclease of toxin-antitoxin system